MSGFFFCGIRLECVENESLNSRKPNSIVLQMITCNFAFDLPPLICGYDSRPSESSGRRDGASNIVPIQSPIERNGFAVAMRQFCCVSLRGRDHRFRLQLRIVDGSQATDAVRVTVTETCLASSKGNFRSSTTTFWIRKVFSKCVANRSASVSIRFVD